MIHNASGGKSDGSASRPPPTPLVETLPASYAYRPSSRDGASSARSAACSLGRHCRAASKLATISNVVSGPVAPRPIGLLEIQATGAMAVVSA